MRPSDEFLDLMGNLVVGARDYGQFRGSDGAKFFFKAGRVVTRDCPPTGWEPWATEQLRLWLEVDGGAVEKLLVAMASPAEFLDRGNRVKETDRKAQIEKWNGFLAPHGWRLIPIPSGASAERIEPTYLPAETTPNMPVAASRAEVGTKAIFEGLIQEGDRVLPTRFEHRPDSIRIISYVDPAQSTKWSTNVVAFLGSTFGEASFHYERAKRHQEQSFLHMQAVQLLAVLRGAAEAFDKGILAVQWHAAEVDLNAWTAAAKGTEANSASKRYNMGPKTKTASILFMDVSGWSKLTAHAIYEYVTKAMPELAKEIKGNDFINTWGDAIVATFGSAKDAAESALRIKALFAQGYPHAGIAEGLTCRISLHAGEVILCENPLKGGEDIFGDAVHMAARLEPATAPGHVFCTSTFATLLNGVSGIAPKALPLPNKLRLPKGYAEIEAFVVTWRGDPDPRPGLVEFLAANVPSEVHKVPVNP